jgi:phosphate acetyltransferase
MKIKSIYVYAQEKGAGSLFVTMGMMDILKKNIDKVAIFRPIIYNKDSKDTDIDFLLQRYNIDIDYEDTYGFDVEYVEMMISKNKTNELINQLIQKFKKLEQEYDFVLCEGIRRSFLNITINYDMNIKIAQNFGSAVINIINAHKTNIVDIYESLVVEEKTLVSEGCTHFATFINRLSDTQHEKLELMLLESNINCFLLKENKELGRLSIQDVIEGTGAEVIHMGEYDNLRVIHQVKVGASSLDNFLQYLEEGDFIVLPADRSELIVGIMMAMYSSNYPNISGIIFPFSMRAHPNIVKLIEGIKDFSIPILCVATDTYDTATIISKIPPRLRVTSKRKIALALGMFYDSTNIESIEKKITSTYNTTMTPIMFEYKLFEMARANKKRIVLPESRDERILRASEIILRRGVAEIILLGKEDEIIENYKRIGVNLDGATIIDHTKSELFDEFVDSFLELRKKKGVSLAAAQDAMLHKNYFATMMVHLGYADGMVSGAIHSTGDTIRPALQIIKTTPNTDIVSSVFFMCLKNKVLVYGDCAVNQDPNASELSQIAFSSAKTAQAFGITPKLAMLSYSTGNSGSGADVDKVKEATTLLQKLHPDILSEGPIQYDAAIDKKVALKKLPNSKVAGDASVFIFPDLNTGNNTYKAVQRSSGAIAIGPILQGLNKPINDLSRGCLVEDIVNTVAITAIQAGQIS